MDYRFHGETGIKVSELCMGTWSFGGEADEETAGMMFHRCRDAGIDFFRCEGFVLLADASAGDRSERGANAVQLRFAVVSAWLP